MHLVTQAHPNAFGCAWRHTSRKPERGEKDSAELVFVKKEAMQRMLAEGSFAELTEDAAGMLGTTYSAIEQVRSTSAEFLHILVLMWQVLKDCDSCVHWVAPHALVQCSAIDSLGPATCNNPHVHPKHKFSVLVGDCKRQDVHYASGGTAARGTGQEC